MAAAPWSGAPTVAGTPLFSSTQSPAAAGYSGTRARACLAPARCACGTGVPDRTGHDHLGLGARITAAVPEPQSAALLFGGLALPGAAARAPALTTPRAPPLSGAARRLDNRAMPPPTRALPAVATPASASTAISGAAFATLLLIALMMGSNHVAARLAFDHGVDVATAVAVRSSVTALVVGALVAGLRVPLALQPRHRRFLPAIGLLIGVQSLCLYASVARLPVALALLAFNTYPLWTALWARVVYAHRAERRVVLAMPVMLLGLALALDVAGAASGLGAALQWQRIGAGVAFALAAAATFGLALVLTQHEAGDLDGRLRTFSTMAIVALLASVGAQAQGGFHWPDASAGWWGLAALTLLYGTAFTIMFTVLPRLGVVGNSAIMNVEPVFALVLAWLVLGQSIAPSQLAGALVVVATVVWLGLRRR